MIVGLAATAVAAVKVGVVAIVVVAAIVAVAVIVAVAAKLFLVIARAMLKSER